MNVDILGDCVQESFISCDDKTDKAHKHINHAGEILSILGLSMPPAQGAITPLFITLNISTKEKILLNKGQQKRQWQDYTINEQRIIISRYYHFLLTISDDFEIHYELTKSMNLHIHCIVYTNRHIKDITVLSKRFFSISPNNRGFIDIRPIYELEPLKDYLENKTEKKYQTSGIKPIIYKKPID